MSSQEERDRKRVREDQDNASEKNDSDYSLNFSSEEEDEDLTTCYQCTAKYVRGAKGWERVEWAGLLYCPQCIVQQCDKCQKESLEGGGRRPKGWRRNELRDRYIATSWTCPSCLSKDKSDSDDEEEEDEDESNSDKSSRTE